ncbi:MAG: LysE family translocator [Pseudomonadota bacterium]
MTVDLTSLGLFAVAMFVLVASPGPFVAAISARSAALGFRSGAAMSVGANLSEALWIAAAMVGLGAVAEAHAWLLSVLRYIGAAWLIWIGLRLIFARQSLLPDPAAPVRREPLWRGFTTGALLNLGNPKAAIFYMTVFPGFFDMGALTTLDMVIIFVVATPIGLLNDLGYAWAAARMGRQLAGGLAARRIDQVSGGVLAGAGAAIATT